MSDKYLIELTVLDKENIVRYIPIVKKYFDFSIGEIRRNALEGRPIVSCYYTKDPDDLIKLYDMIKEIKDRGANVEIIENIDDVLIENIDMEIIKNLIQRRKEIDEETERIIDLEVGEEDDEAIEEDEQFPLRIPRSFDDEDIMTLTLDNDEEIDCIEVATFPVQGEDYIALMQLDEKVNSEEPTIFFYRLEESEEDNFELGNITDEKEYEAVANIFDELFRFENVD